MLANLTDVRVMLALVAVALLLALVAVCVQHAVGARSRPAARRWSFAAAAFGATCLGAVMIATGLIIESPRLTEVGVVFGGSIVAAIFIAVIRIGILYEIEYVAAVARLVDARRALHEYQTNLEAIVSRRTQALRREIEERRRVQRELSDAARRSDEELKYARDLQQALLASPPACPFARVQTNYQPAALVSGDTYSFHCDQDALSVLLADAMGHGVSAALLTQVVLAGAIRMLPTDDGPQIFAGLNRMLALPDQSAYVTASWLKLAATGELRFCGAGNAPLLIWRAGLRQVETLDGSGLALGMFEQMPAPHAEQRVQLDPGDRVYLMTDGLLEWANSRSELFGSERAADVIADLAADSLSESVAGLQATAWEFADMTPCRDDITVIALEYQPGASGKD